MGSQICALVFVLSVLQCQATGIGRSQSLISRVWENEAPPITVEVTNLSDGKLRQIRRQSQSLITLTNLPIARSLQNNPFCIKAGYIPDPNDCTKFFNCVPIPSGFEIVSLNCVIGTSFEESESRCMSGVSVATSCSKSITQEEDLNSEFTIENSTKRAFSQTSEDELETKHEVEEHITEERHLASLSNHEEFAEFLNDDVEDVEEFDPKHSEFKTFSNNEEFRKTRVIATQHSSPNAWFGLIKTNGKPGNPFPEDETNLAVILDFSTSRLQIYSRNMPKKR